MSEFINHILPLGGSSSGITVQTGEIVLSNGNSSVQDTILSVTMNKSWMVFSYKSPDTVNDPNKNLVRGKILNSTTLEFKTNANTNVDITIQWFVITHPASSNVMVQHSGDVSFNTTPLNVSISSVDLAHSFSIASFGTNDVNWDDSNLFTHELTSSTNIQFQAGSAFTSQVNFQVIENLDWDVSKYTDSMMAGDTFEGTPISAIVLAETLLIGSARFTGGILQGDTVPRYYFNNTTEIAAFRPQSGIALDFVYYVIDTNGEVAVQHDDTEQINSSSSSNNSTISSIDVNKSAIFQGALLPGLASNISNFMNDGEDIWVKHKINTSSQINQERGASPSSIINYSLQVWDFS